MTRISSQPPTTRPLAPAEPSSPSGSSQVKPNAPAATDEVQAPAKVQREFQAYQIAGADSPYVVPERLQPRRPAPKLKAGIAKQPSLSAQVKQTQGFKQLEPDERRRLKDLMGDQTSITGQNVRDQVDWLLKDPSFGRMNGTEQAAELRGLFHIPGDYVKRAKALPGFAALPERRQERLKSLLGGATNHISRQARFDFDALCADPAFANGTAKDQARSLRALMREPQEQLADAMLVSNKEPRAYKVSGPDEIKDYPFRGSTEDALSYRVRIGRDITEVVLPKDRDGASSLDEIGEALARTKPNARRAIERVVANPEQNPDDAFWAQEYGIPDFKSFMTAGAAGEVTIYPDHNQPPQAISDAFTHEAGHTVSLDSWGEGETEPEWNDWRRSMKRDGTSPSEYATSHMFEDFAESYDLFMRSRGTRQHSELRDIFPDRFSAIDKLLERRAGRG